MTRKRIFSIHVTTIATGRPSVVFNRRTRDGGQTTTRHYAIDRHDWIRPVIDRIRAVQPSHDVYDHPAWTGNKFYTAIEILGRHGDNRAFDALHPRLYIQLKKQVDAIADYNDRRRAMDDILREHGFDFHPVYMASPELSDDLDEWDDEWD